MTAKCPKKKYNKKNRKSEKKMVVDIKLTPVSIHRPLFTYTIEIRILRMVCVKCDNQQPTTYSQAYSSIYCKLCASLYTFHFDMFLHIHYIHFSRNSKVTWCYFILISFFFVVFFFRSMYLLICASISVFFRMRNAKQPITVWTVFFFFCLIFYYFSHLSISFI